MLDSVAGSIPASSSRIQSPQIYNSVAGSIPASSNRIWVIGSYFGSELSGVESHKQEFGVKWFLDLGGNSQRAESSSFKALVRQASRSHPFLSPRHETCDRFKSYGPPAERFRLDRRLWPDHFRVNPLPALSSTVSVLILPFGPRPLNEVFFI